MGSLLSVLDDVTVPHSMMSYLGGTTRQAAIIERDVISSV